MNTVSPTIQQTGSRKISQTDGLPPHSLHLYAIVVACATFVLLLAGGLVTSTGSSLAVPDWPLSNGQLFPKMEGGVLYEHGHRMIAGTVGLLTFILAGWLWRRKSPLKYLGFAAAFAVCLQATLGGLTVLYRLPVPVSVAHACLGQIFFCLVVSIAVLTGSATLPRWPAKLTKFQRLGMMTFAFVFFQLIAGATLRHTGRFLHLHLLGAFLVVIHIQLLARRVMTVYSIKQATARLAMGLSLLVMIQLFLGYISWKTGPVLITTAHVGIGALLLAGSLIITLQAFREPA
jgi:cytochrome c oxidase assembly protein subunit 15